MNLNWRGRGAQRHDRLMPSAIARWYEIWFAQGRDLQIRVAPPRGAL